MDLREFFQEHNDEYLKFDRVQHKLSTRPDIHAFLLIDSLVPGNTDMICSADHDEIYLDVSTSELMRAATEQQLIDLHRCGVRCGRNGVCMFA